MSDEERRVLEGIVVDLVNTRKALPYDPTGGPSRRAEGYINNIIEKVQRLLQSGQREQKINPHGSHHIQD